MLHGPDILYERFCLRVCLFVSFSISLCAFEQIIQVNLTAEELRQVTPGATLDFTYSIHWEETNIPFRKRFDRYLDNSFFEHQVRNGQELQAWSSAVRWQGDQYLRRLKKPGVHLLHPLGKDKHLFR